MVNDIMEELLTRHEVLAVGEQRQSMGSAFVRSLWSKGNRNHQTGSGTMAPSTPSAKP